MLKLVLLTNANTNMSIDNSLKTLFASMALMVTSATLLHDTKLDKAYSLAIPVSFATRASQGGQQGRFDQSSSVHTHIVRSSLARASSEATPRIQPRDDRKHYLPKYTSRYNTYFGTAGVVWPSA